MSLQIESAWYLGIEPMLRLIPFYSWICQIVHFFLIPLGLELLKRIKWKEKNAFLSLDWRRWSNWNHLNIYASPLWNYVYASTDFQCWVPHADHPYIPTFITKTGPWPIDPRNVAYDRIWWLVACHWDVVYIALLITWFYPTFSHCQSKEHSWLSVWSTINMQKAALILEASLAILNSVV